MGIKSTRYVSRQKAIEILLTDIPQLPNDALADLLDRLADTRQSRVISYFDNFIVTEFGPPDEEQS